MVHIMTLTQSSFVTVLLLGGQKAAAFSSPVAHHVAVRRGIRASVASSSSSASASSRIAPLHAAANGSSGRTSNADGVIDAEVVDVSDTPNQPIVQKAPPQQDPSWRGPQVEIPDIFQFDLTGGRPGAIIESEEELARKEEMFNEINSGSRDYPAWFDDYGTLAEDEEAVYDNNDPNAIDASTLGSYDIKDLQARFDYEWDPVTGADPNTIADPSGYIQENERDEEGVEVGYDPMFGPSNPVDIRTKTGAVDSYMIDEQTRNNEMLTPQFLPDDPELQDNEDFVKFRKSLDIIESYTDEFLPEMTIPRHVAKWYGEPEMMKYPPKPYSNNRFTEAEDLTNFDAMDPYRARRRAVELARSNNAEWLPDGVSQSWHRNQRRPYDEVGTLVGTLESGHCDPDVVELITPALNVLGSSADLLSIEQGSVFRFHYHGLIKNKYGMACWTETLIRDCGVDVSGVVFETGFRARDPAYDGGDPYYGFA